MLQIFISVRSTSNCNYLGNPSITTMSRSLEFLHLLLNQSEVTDFVKLSFSTINVSNSCKKYFSTFPYYNTMYPNKAFLICCQTEKNENMLTAIG